GAQLLIVSQAKLSSLSQHRATRNFEGYWRYHGRVRPLQLWDESCSPAEPIVVRASQIAALANRLDKLGWANHAAAIRQLEVAIRKASHTAFDYVSMDRPLPAWFDALAEINESP